MRVFTVLLFLLQPIISVHTELVVVPVSVTDAGGNHVTGLTQNDFAIRDNGKAEPVAVFVDLTGCRLRPDSAEFVVAVLKDQPPELKWHVGGDVNDPRLSKTTGCSTTFEPFEGRLTSFSMEPKAD